VKEKFKILPLSKIIRNNKELKLNNKFVTLKNYDTLQFNCDPGNPCLMPHYFHILYPNDSETEAYIKTSYSVFEKRNRITGYNKSHKRANWAKFLNESVG
jgi:hypothetical protein